MIAIQLPEFECSCKSSIFQSLITKSCTFLFPKISPEILSTYITELWTKRFLAENFFSVPLYWHITLARNNDYLLIIFPRSKLWKFRYRSVEYKQNISWMIFVNIALGEVGSRSVSQFGMTCNCFLAFLHPFLRQCRL